MGEADGANGRQVIKRQVRSVTILEQALAEVDGVAADLELATPRLTLTASYGERTSSGSKTAPVPVDVAALDAKFALHRWLVSQAIRLRKPFSNRTIKGVSSHLFTHLPTIRANGWDEEMGAQLRALLDECEAVTFQAENRRHIGPCATVGCETPLTARETDQEANCEVCGQSYNVRYYLETRVAEALGADGTPLRASEAVRYLTQKGIKVSTKDIENWVKWGHLTEVDRDHKGRRLYNLKDIYTRAVRNTA